MVEKIPTSDQRHDTGPDDAERQELRREAEDLQRELKSTIAGLDAGMKRSQDFIDDVNAVGAKLNEIGDKLERFLNRFLPKS